MGSFKWQYGGEWIEIVFSLIENAEWLDDDHDVVVFDYLDYSAVMVGLDDLDIEESEYDRDLWNMLLQVTNLDAT